jgi:CO dehydrogenase/acetyl-CoA synthase gamma subunit (corrinoid Fe-S protein)
MKWRLIAFAFEALNVACALLSCISDRAANAVSVAGTGFLARRIAKIISTTDEGNEHERDDSRTTVRS